MAGAEKGKHMANTRILGIDLEVSAIGLGCMGFTHAYGKLEDETAAIDKNLDKMNMSGVFGGSPVRKG